MATNSADSPDTSSQSTARSSVLARSAVPYYIAAVFALATIAWYVFIFVPSKVEYFVGLKLRALAVAASQIEARADNLATALRTVPPEISGDGDLAVYLRTLVPDIKLLTEDRAKPAGLRLRRPSTTEPASGPTQPVQTAATAAKAATAHVAWDGVVAQAASSTLEFDDLIVGLPNGDVVWQREKTTPRIGNLAQVLASAQAESGWFSLDWSPRPILPKTDAGNMPTAVAAKPVEVGGTGYLLLVQTIRLPSNVVAIEPAPVASTNDQGSASQVTPPLTELRLHVAGLVPLATLRAQAMNIPVAWVVALSLPVIVLFLALPFVKLATLTSHERFSFVDAVLLLVATLTIAGLGAALPLTQTVVDDATDEGLSTFSTSLQSRMVQDVRKVQALASVLEGETADSIEQKLQPCEVKASFPLERCNFWAALEQAGGSTNVSAGEIDLDIIAWLDRSGGQIDKWTTKAQLTGQTPHDRFQHYADLTLGRLWTLKKEPLPDTQRAEAPPVKDAAQKAGDTQGTDDASTKKHEERPFTIEPLRSPTTAELAVIVAFPLDGAKESGGQPQAGKAGVKPAGAKAERPNRSTAAFLALNVRPGSLLDVVVPPGLGFAVISQDGRVLFHSQENLSLGENFFEEVGEPGRVRARAASGRVATWTGDYHGRPHRIHIERPVALEGCPWRIVTFRELTPDYARAFAHQSGTFRLALINLIALAVVASITWLRARFKHRDARDMLNVRSIARPGWIWVHAGLVAIAIVAVVLSYQAWAGRVLNGFYGFFVLLPFAALRIAWLARKPTDSKLAPKPSDSKTEYAPARWLVWAELAALVALIAALPGLGFARIAERVQVSRASERLLEETQRLIAARNGRVLARVNSPAYTFPPQASSEGKPATDTRALLKKAKGFAHVDATNYPYLKAVDVEFAPAPAVATSKPETGQGLVRFLLEWNPLPSTDLAGEPATVVEQGQFRLNSPPGSGLPALSVRDGSTGPPPFLAKLTPFSAPPLKGVFGVLLVAAAIGGICWARQRLIAHVKRDAPSLKKVMECLPREGRHGLMLIGAPRTNKDTVLARTLRRRNAKLKLRIRLFEKEAQPELVDSQLEAIARGADGWWQRWMHPAARPAGYAWINVSNLETHLVHLDRRKRVLEVLERLLDRGPDDLSRVVVVTTNVDPVAHFEEIFEAERVGIYKDAVPEVALSRFAVLLTRFHRCYVPFGVDSSAKDPWWDYDDTRWLKVLKWETRSIALKRVRRELRKQWSRDQSVSIDDLSRAIANRAAAVYQLLWTSCTRREKLVLVQLAQEGFVTPQSADVVAALMAKGLIVMRPGPAIFNHTFRSFLRGIERTDVVREWERIEGSGLWVVAGRLIGSSVVAGGLFFLLTQGYSIQGLLPVLSGTGLFGVPIVRNLVARLTSKGSPQSA